MTVVAIDRRQSAAAWPVQPQFYAHTTRFQPGSPTYISAPESPLPPHNDVELSRDMLIEILEYFSQLVEQLFTGRSIRMVVHGGACMLLHPGLYSLSQQQLEMIPSYPRRTTTRDVDYIHRSFVAELASYGMPDAALKLQECIETTARHFGLGGDWMNSHADIALPMAHECVDRLSLVSQFDPHSSSSPSGRVYDPIYEASIKQNNIDLHTIFRSTNGILTLISVTPFWAVSLKLVRYTRWDPGDICLLLRNGMVLSGTIWTPETIEDWLFRNCRPMGYHNFDLRRKADMRARILHAIELLSNWNTAVEPSETTISVYDAMGGGDMMGDGEYGGNNGWSYSYGKWPNQVQQQQPQPQAQVSSVQYTISNPTLPAGPVNVRDWVKDDDPPSPSPSPPPHSRRSSIGNSQDIFIPPNDDWVDPDHPPISFRPRSWNPTQQQQQQQQQLEEPQQQAQVSYVQFPISNPTPAAGLVNVRDWVRDDDPPSPSPSPHSRRSSTSNRQDIFIPPDSDWINSNHPSISFRFQSRNPTPEPTDWHHSAESSNNNNNSPPGSRVTSRSFFIRIFRSVHKLYASLKSSSKRQPASYS